MKRTLTFEATCIDTRRVRAAAGEATFFVGDLPQGEAPAASVTRLVEGAVLPWVLTAYPTPPKLICHHLQMPESSKHRFGIPTPLMPGGPRRPGDIDWLCADKQQPHLAVGVECKRVKVLPCPDGTDKTNRLM